MKVRFVAAALALIASPGAIATLPEALIPNGESFKGVEILLSEVSRRRPFHSVTFNSDSTVLVTGSLDGRIQLWDMDRGIEITSLVGHRLQVNSVTFNPAGDILASGSSDHTVRLWNVTQGTEIRRFEGHRGGINSVAFNPDGGILASAAEDATVRLWNVAEDVEIARFEDHSVALAVAFSPDGANLAWASADGTLRLWDVAQRVEINRFEGHEDQARSVVFHPNDRIMASGSDDATIRLWDVSQGTEFGRLEGHSSGVLGIHFSPDGYLLASASSDATVRLWDVTQETEILRFESHTDWVTSVAFSPTGGMLASASEDRTVRLWDVGEGSEIRRFEGHATGVPAVAYSPGGEILAVASSDGTVRLWDVELGAEIGRLEGHTALVRALTMSPDGTTLASASSDGTVRLWDIGLGSEIGRFDSFALSLAFSLEGTTLASGLLDGTIRLWNATRGIEVGRFEGHTLMVRSVAFSPDGTTLVSGSADGTVRLWDVAQGTEIRRFEGHVGSILAVAFSPDGTTLASAGEDRTLRLLDVHRATEVGQFDSHGALTVSVSFSPDGTILASAADDENVYLWDVARRREISRLEGHGAEVLSVAFSPDGTTLASASLDRTVVVWSRVNKTDYQLSRRLLGGQRGTWIGCRADDECLRSDDGTLLVRRDAQGFLQPIPPEPAEGRGSLHLVSAPEVIETYDGRATPFVLRVKNRGPGPVFWPNVHPVDAAEVPSLVFHPPDPPMTLEPGEEVDLQCRVSSHALYDSPAELSTILRLEVSSAHGEPLPVDPIKIHAKVPQLVWNDARWLRNGGGTTLLVSLTNVGSQDLSETEFTARISGLEAQFPKVLLLSVSAGNSITVSFSAPPGFELPRSGRVTVDAYQLTHPVHRWSFSEKHVLRPSGSPLLLPLMLLVLLVVPAVVLFRHPIVTELSTRPEMLFERRPTELLLVRRLLTLTGRLGSVLSRNDVDRRWLDSAIIFSTETDPETRCRLLVERLGLHADGLFDDQACLWKLRLGPEFPLNLMECVLYLPPRDRATADVVQDLRTRTEVTLVLSPDPSCQKELHRRASDPGNLWVAPEGALLTRLLLAADPMEALAKLLASQVSFIRVSPYQQGFGVVKASAFYGRREVLDHILNREPANYLILGARQIGKSSLLNAIERHYRGHPQVRCHYLVLGDPLNEYELSQRLAGLFDLPRDTSPEEVFSGLAEEGKGACRQLVLVDEADAFVRSDCRSGYKTLGRLRSLSAEGHCYFILAGFWALFEAAVLDYQTPLMNFGETLRIGALEEDACRALATRPMKTMGLEYASDDLVKHVIQRTGQRANLISIVSNEILKNLALGEKTIEADTLDRALGSAAVHRALAGWKTLTRSREGNRLDRIVVYATIDRETFSQTEVLERLDELGVDTTPEQVEHSLERLALAFVLEHEAERYRYQVPLLTERILAQEPETLLRLELKSRRST